MVFNLVIIFCIFRYGHTSCPAKQIANSLEEERENKLIIDCHNKE